MTGLTGTQSADDLLNKPEGNGFKDANSKLGASQAELNKTLQSTNSVNLCIMDKTATKKATKKATTGQELLEPEEIMDIKDTCMGEHNETKKSFADYYLNLPNDEKRPPLTLTTFLNPNRNPKSSNSVTICSNDNNDCKQKQKDEEMKKKHEEIKNQQKAAMAGVSALTTRQKELFKSLDEKEKEKKKQEANQEAIRPLSAASEPAVSAAGGARKSRKHKRTRKHMRKHTRKHKVMKSKMTKSKSKKVMQKGGKYGAHGPKMNEFREKRQEAIVNSLKRVGKLKVATRRIKEMKEEEKKRNRRK